MDQGNCFFPVNEEDKEEEEEGKMEENKQQEDAAELYLWAKAIVFFFQ